MEEQVLTENGLKMTHDSAQASLEQFGLGYATSAKDLGWKPHSVAWLVWHWESSLYFFRNIEEVHKTRSVSKEQCFQLLCSSVCQLCKVLGSACGHMARVPVLTFWDYRLPKEPFSREFVSGVVPFRRLTVKATLR